MLAALLAVGLLFGVVFGSLAYASSKENGSPEEPWLEWDGEEPEEFR